MKVSSSLVYDVTNVIALLFVGAGVWLVFGLGWALAVVGALVLGLNLLQGAR